MKKTTVSLMVIIVCFVFMLTACMQTTIRGENNTLNDCSAYQGDFCAMEYKPVCGKLNTGEWKTFGNACTACISREIIGYKEGEC